MTDSSNAAAEARLLVLIEAARSVEATMTPGAYAALRADVRRSWSIGELLISHPQMTRAEAAAIIDRATAAIDV